MSQSPQVPPEQFVESMREEVEQYLKQMMEAVNKRRMAIGLLAVRNRFEILPQRCGSGIFEQAVQKRVDAAEAAFPPSAPSDDGKATGE